MTMRIRLASPAALLFAAGCAAMPDGGPNTPPPRADFRVHLAFAEPREGAIESEDREGRTVYVTRRAFLTNQHVADARALESADGTTLLQIVLDAAGAQQLYDVTQAHYEDDTLVYGVLGREGRLVPPAHLAIFLEGELVSAPPIDAAVTGGEIHLLDLFSAKESARLAAALQPGPVRP